MDNRRKVSVMKMGQVLIKNVAQCGGCGKLHEWSFWTSRIHVDIELREVLKWANTHEYGLLCPECQLELFEEIEFKDD